MTTHRRSGLTLFELLLVLGILLVLGTLVVPAVSGHLAQSREDVTWQSLRQIRETVMNTYFDDMGQRMPRPADPVGQGRADHPQLCYLFVNPEFHEDGYSTTEDYDTSFDPVARRGWRGPYLLHEGGGFSYQIDDAAHFTSRYGEAGDPAILDGWGQPIILQEPDADGSGTIDFDESRSVRLVSAGPNRVLDTDPDVLRPSPAQRGDDLVLFLRIAE